MTVPTDPLLCPTCSRQFKTAQALADHTRSTHNNPHWVKRKALKQKPAPVCPKCGNDAKLSQGKYGTKAECCGLWSWDRKPLVSRETHSARIEAHRAFDPLWKSGQMSRGEAYRRLQIAMGMTSAECHIGQMTVEQAERVVAAVKYGRLDADPDARELAA